VLEKLGLEVKRIDIAPWKKLVELIDGPFTDTVKIGIIAKYIATGEFELQDSYASLLESLKHASWHTRKKAEIIFINAEDLERKEHAAVKNLETVDAIIVPIGWGSRGVEGKISAITYARKNKVPYLGLCYGMQLAAIEYAREVLGCDSANTEEVDPVCKDRIIHSIPFDPKYQRIKGEGASMRLGAYDCVLKEGTLAHQIYKKHHAFKDEKNHIISERHRHRYEFNNDYRARMEEAGFVISGTSPDDFFVEMIELSQDVHPFFIATQAHPEYKSQPLNPHPMFVEFLEAAANKK
jgi:CTP synthase